MKAKKTMIMRTMENNKREILISILVSVIGIIAIYVAEFSIAKSTAVSFPVEVWIDGSKILDFFFPLFVSLPFSWMLFYEKKDGFLNYAAMRTDKKKYIFSRIMTGMIAAFVTVFIIYYVGLFVAVSYIKPEYIVNDNILYRYMWGYMQAHNPLLFGVFWCAWKGFIGSLICGFGYLIALVADNLFVIALLPFLYCTIENFITGTLHLERFSITTSYILDRLSPVGMSLLNYVAGIITFLILGSAIIVAFNIKMKRAEHCEELD